MRDVIIIPTYNERENIKIIVPKIFSLLPEIHILVVDDNSPDGTQDEVEKLKSQFPNLSLLRKEKKEGLGAAYKYALMHLASDSSIRTICTVDADGSHDPEYLKKMLAARQEHDLVVGSRYVQGGGVKNWPLKRQFLSKGGNIYAKIITGLPINDITAGFVAFDKKLLEKIHVESISATGYAYQIEFKYRCVHAGATVTEVPIIFKEREIGQSKISGSIIAEGILTPLRLRFKR